MFNPWSQNGHLQSKTGKKLGNGRGSVITPIISTHLCDDDQNHDIRTRDLRTDYEIEDNINSAFMQGTGAKGTDDTSSDVYQPLLDDDSKIPDKDAVP